MTVYEQISYLKGLVEGLGVDENNKYDKIIKAIIDVLDEIAVSIDELEDVSEELCEQILRKISMRMTIVTVTAIAVTVTFMRSFVPLVKRLSVLKKVFLIRVA